MAVQVKLSQIFICNAGNRALGLSRTVTMPAPPVPGLILVGLTAANWVELTIGEVKLDLPTGEYLAVLEDDVPDRIDPSPPSDGERLSEYGTEWEVSEGVAMPTYNESATRAEELMREAIPLLREHAGRMGSVLADEMENYLKEGR